MVAQEVEGKHIGLCLMIPNKTRRKLVPGQTNLEFSSPKKKDQFNKVGINSEKHLFFSRILAKLNASTSKENVEQ